MLTDNRICRRVVKSEVLADERGPVSAEQPVSEFEVKKPIVCANSALPGDPVYALNNLWAAHLGNFAVGEVREAFENLGRVGILDRVTVEEAVVAVVLVEVLVVDQLAHLRGAAMKLGQMISMDAGDLLLSPPFVDAHFHMDATLSYGLPRVNQSGTLLEGIALWGELKPLLTAEALIERALAYCDWAVAQGLLAIRSHVDVCDPRLLAVDALLEVKRRVAPYLDLQLVAFPQDGVLRSPGALDLLKEALRRGVDVVGGIPHFERTMAEGAASVKLLCELARSEERRVGKECRSRWSPYH